MIDPKTIARRLLLGVSALLALLAVVAFLVIAPTGQPDHTAAADSPAPASPPQDTAAPRPHPAAPAVAPPTASASAQPAAPPTPLARTAEGRIDPASLDTFTPQPYSGGVPAYDGEPVTAYVAVPSTGRKVSLIVNQLGEFPRIATDPGESVEVRLAFTATPPGTPIALAAQDGGKLHTGKLSAAFPLDGTRQLAFAFTVSANVGSHRVSFTTPTGEINTLEFWAGPPPVLMQSAIR